MKVSSWYGSDGFLSVWYHNSTDSGDFHKTFDAYSWPGWPEDPKKFAQFFENVAKTVAKKKICQNIFNKAQFLSPKQLQQNPSEHLKYIQ